MSAVRYAQRAAELETAIVEAFVELDKADGSRIGLQEAIDASQSVLREAYGDELDQDASQYMENSEDETEEFEEETE